MDVIGEVHCSLTRGQWTFELDALVVRQLDVDILAGNPFMVRNDIGVRPAKRQIVIGDTDYQLRLIPQTHVNQMCGVHNPSYYATPTPLLFYQGNMFSSVPPLTLTPTPGGPLSQS